MEIFVILLLAALTAAWFFLKRPFEYWTRLGVPQFPITFPQGNIKGLGKDFHISEFLVDYYQKTKKIGADFCGFYMFTRPMFFIVDLDLIKTILVKDFNTFPNRGIYHNEADDPISAHLFNLENDP